MRRGIGVMVAGVLVAALCTHVAAAAPSLTYSGNLQTALFERLFGESTDGEASLAASYGDRVSESILRTRALRPRLPSVPSILAEAPAAIAFDGPVAMAYDFEPQPLTVPAEPRPLVRFSNSAPQEPLLATYHSVLPVPIVTAGPAAFEFDTQAPAASPPLVTFSPVVGEPNGFDASAGTSAPQLGASSESSVSVPVPVRVGKVQIQTRFEGAQTQAPELSLSDQASSVGANINLRAGAHNLNLDVAGGLEHFTVGDGMPLASSNFDGTSSFQLPSQGAPMLVPSFADVTQHTVATGLAMPLARNLSFGVQYDMQHLQGGYGSPGLSNLDAQANTYGANLTLALPHLSGAIVFSAKQYRYQDNLLPTNTFTQTRADLNYTVKF